MRAYKYIVPFFLTILVLTACKKDDQQGSIDVSTEVTPVDINIEGFELLEKMQGHWVGSNQVLSWQFDWFTFDYRAISESHVFGIYEGGAQGNLFTSFFVTDYKNTRTIMARNGGVLSGIYRTSYFVLDSVSSSGGSDYYRLVDAVGGSSTMYMELVFTGDDLCWNAYTSRLGQSVLPTRHMTFKATKKHISLSQSAANSVGFPSNTPAWDFAQGFNEAWLYDGDETTTVPQSATFAAQQNNNDVYTLAVESGDPFTITDHPFLGTLQVDINRNAQIQDAPLLMYLSTEPLTDNSGLMVGDLETWDTVLLFPVLLGTDNEFLITYLHPGDYYVTIIADANSDEIPSTGDYSHVSQSVTVAPETNAQITIDNITVQN